jgi:hypothetical protein
VSVEIAAGADIRWPELRGCLAVGLGCRTEGLVDTPLSMLAPRAHSVANGSVLTGTGDLRLSSLRRSLAAARGVF